jgi:hypothetical protein
MGEVLAMAPSDTRTETVINGLVSKSRADELETVSSPTLGELEYLLTPTLELATTKLDEPEPLSVK